MAYVFNGFTSQYISNCAIGSGQREDQVDHAWNRILTRYFPARRYSVERESYLLRNRRWRANAAVVNFRAGRLRKVLVFEAKRPPAAVPGPREWAAIRDQLQRNMRRARAAQGLPVVQTMYGIAAIGPLVRMYAMWQHDPNGRLTIVATRIPTNTMHVRTDATTIQRILQQIESLIQTGSNDY